MKLLLVFILAINCKAAVTATVQNVTPTQATIAIAGTNGSACLVEVSISPTYSPLINDVNETLFAGSGHTSRLGTVGIGTPSPTFVVGTRGTAYQSSSGAWYSRALAAVTPYYWRVNNDSACGSGTPTGTFVTPNIPMGRLWNEPPPPHYPQLLGRNSVVDPQTGAVIAGVQAVGDSPNAGATNTGTNVAFAAPIPDAAATWSCSGGVLPCTYNSTNQAKLFLPIAFGTQIGWSYDNITNGFLAYVQAHATLSVTASTVIINGCLTNNGVTCATATVTNTITTTPTAYTYGSTAFNWQGWGGDATLPLAPPQIAVRNGSATNSAGVLTVSGTPTFLPPYPANTPINLTTCTGGSTGIKRLSGAQTDSDQQITLTANPGCTGTVNWTLDPFGLLLWANDTSSHNITVASSGTVYDAEVDYEAQYESSAMQCSYFCAGGPAITLNGCDHYMDYQTGGTGWYLIAPSGCDSPRFLGAWTAPGKGGVNPAEPIPAGNAYASGPAIFDPINVGVVTAPIPAYNSDTALLSVKYWPNGVWASQPAGTIATICNSLTAPTNQPCIAITYLENSLLAKLNAYSAEFSASCCAVGPYTTGGCPDGTVMMQVINASQQGSTGMMLVYNPGTSSFVAARSITGWYPNTNNGFHSSIPACAIVGGKRLILAGAQEGWASSDGLTVPGTNPGAGPYRTKITGGLGNTTSACPSRPGGSVIAVADWPGGTNNPGNLCTVSTSTSIYWEDPSPYQLTVTGTVASMGTAVSTAGIPMLPNMAGKPVFIGGVQYTIATVVDNSDFTLSMGYAGGSACAGGCTMVIHGEPSCSDIGLTCDTSTNFALRAVRVGDKGFVGTPTPGGNGYSSYEGSTQGGTTEALLAVAVSGTSITWQRNYGGLSTITNWGGPTYIYGDSGTYSFFTRLSYGDGWSMVWDSTDNPDGSLVALYPDIIDGPFGGIQQPTLGHNFAGATANVGDARTTPAAAQFPTTNGSTVAWAMQAQSGVQFSYINTVPTYQTWISPFNGQPTGMCSTPNTCDDHPYLPVISGKQFVIGSRVFNGAGQMCGGSTPGTRVSGSLFKFTYSQCNFPAAANAVSAYKILVWAAQGNHHFLTDVSSSTSIIGGTTTDNWKWCFTVVVNECVSGSAVGDVYANVPGVSYIGSNGAPLGEDGGDTLDINIGPLGPWVHGNVQLDFGSGTSYFGGTSRWLGHSLTNYRYNTGYWNVRSDPTGSSMVSQSVGVNTNQITQTVMYLTPIAYDTINGADYIPTPVTCNQISGANGCAVEFGYAENGATTGYYCTTRAESCITTNVTTTGGYSFAYETTGAWTPASFSAGTVTVIVPAISGRMLYYRVKQYNSGTLVYTGPQQIVGVP